MNPNHQQHEKDHPLNVKYEVIPINGFTGCGLHSGVKRKKKDLGIVVCSQEATTAAVFTQNVTKGAPVILSQGNLLQAVKAKKGMRALLVNSGNANACTGAQGMMDARSMALQAADHFGLEASEVLVASTGIIGLPLDMDKIGQGIGKLSEAMSKDLLPFGQSMMTTDTYLKVASLKVDIQGQVVSFLGLAKGSGMIHPNMATMLGFIFTDAAVEAQYLQNVLSAANGGSFNMISVDGDTSTNDMVVMMASNAVGFGAGPQENVALEAHSPGAAQFEGAVEAICQSLAIQIAKDGEGATKMLAVTVEGALDLESARKAARAVVSSSLVKAAFFGQDANWGRIACALGYSGAHFHPESLSISFASRLGHLTLLEKGRPVDFDEEMAFELLRADIIDIAIDLAQGPDRATAWGCDLSYDYVKINGAYRT